MGEHEIDKKQCVSHEAIHLTTLIAIIGIGGYMIIFGILKLMELIL